MSPMDRSRVLVAAYGVVALLVLAHGVLTYVDQRRFLQWVTSADAGEEHRSWLTPAGPLLVVAAAAAVVVAVVAALRGGRRALAAVTALLLVPLALVSPLGPWDPTVPGWWAVTGVEGRPPLLPRLHRGTLVADGVALLGALALLVRARRA